MRQPPRDDGTAIIEFVFVAVILMVPLVYFLVAVSAIQGAAVAASQAAREAGRAFATAPSTQVAYDRAQLAVTLALSDEGLTTAPAVTFVAAGDSCNGRAVTPALDPGSEFAACVRLRVAIPGVPRILAGRGITETGRYVVHVDDFRTAR